MTAVTSCSLPSPSPAKNMFFNFSSRKIPHPICSCFIFFFSSETREVKVQPEVQGVPQVKDFKQLEETRSAIRKETRRCLSEILSEIAPPKQSQSTSGFDKTSVRRESNESDCSSDSNNFIVGKKKALPPLDYELGPPKAPKSSPPPLEILQQVSLFEFIIQSHLCIIGLLV